MKTSCTKYALTDSYYLFEYKGKLDAKDTGVFQCGTHAAKHFLSLINHKGLSLFNPLQQLNVKKTSTGGSNASNPSEWKPAQLQFYLAISLLVVCWNKPMNGVLAKYLTESEKFKTYEPNDTRIKVLNSIIGKDAKKRSLTKMIDELRVENPTLKTYSFNLLEEKLLEKGIESNFS